VIIDESYLEHYGTPRKSGRYPWGSGEDHRNSRSFLDAVDDLRRNGFSEKDIAASFGVSTTDLRAYKTIAKNEEKAAQIVTAESLKAKGMSNVAAAKQMGIPESTFRTLIAPGASLKADAVTTAVNILRAQVDKVGYLDVGAGTEMKLNISPQRLKTALSMLKAEGYNVHSNVPAKQLGTGHDTKMRILTAGDKTWGDARNNLDKVRLINERISDDGRTSLGILPPLPISPRRLAIKYGSEGGAERDGVMYIRPGVKDLDIGGSRYAQVRIQVGKGHYLKGMAIYKDDLPAGVDVLFHTNKESTGNKLDALKELSTDPANPFGAWIQRQITKHDPRTGIEKVTSAVNIVNEEGGWTKWSRTIASQVLSKQSPKLAKEQLDRTFNQRKADLDEIMALTNPTVKRKLLEEFAQGSDSAAVHLKAASLPKQAWHVILPISSLKDTEIYAPNYENGTSVALIRYPHGGTFEIPILTVNNRNREGTSLISKIARDAVGINAKVAERLSGADFDGDTVLVIPNNTGKIKSSPALEGLKDFNPKEKYREYPGMKVMRDTQKQMGVISNLITDMTIRNASDDELARAVRHSMVVIDAEKHRLNYRQSAQDNSIRALQEKYQRKADGTGGASTIISRAKSEPPRPEVKPRPAKDGGPVDKKTGELVWVPTGRIDNRTGELATTKRFKALELERDAHALSSGTPIEKLYADHSNRLKAIANQARLDAERTPLATYHRSAAKVYAKEVDYLEAQLALARENAPLERRAQLLAGQIVKEKKEASIEPLDKAAERKLKGQALEAARNRLGAKKHKIEIGPDEWKAIQAGAISDTKLKAILDSADMDKVRELATPKTKILMTTSRTNQAKLLLGQGLTRAEVAAKLGVSLTTLDRAIGGE
jgi:predicted DNA-binding protein (UPF0251 family)